MWLQFLIMSAKLVTLGFIKIKKLWIKVYDVKISGHEVISKNLLRDSNKIVDVVMWIKFRNTSISKRVVVMTPTLKGFNQKNQFFWEMVLVQVQ